MEVGTLISTMFPIPVLRAIGRRTQHAKFSFDTICAMHSKHEELHKKIDALHAAHVPMTHQKFSGRKRFYKQVGVQTTANGKYCITLDGRTLKTPARNPLHLESKELAMAIAAEWDGQTDERKGIEPVTMPLMTLASTAIDQIKLEPLSAIQTCMKYLPTDSALFFTNESDRILLSKQRKHLSPVIRWVSRQLKIELSTTIEMTGRIAHSPETVTAFEEMLQKMDHFTLACMQNVTSECKSLVLATAFLGRYLSLDQIKSASRIEEEFQVEMWGVVEGGHDMDRLNNSVNLASVGLFMSLYNQSNRHTF